MRRKLILLCIAAQVLVLAVMAGERETILATGERVFLRTAPIDPRDPFRGDFVRLSYAVGSVAPEQLRGRLADPEVLAATEKGARVYAVLEKGADGVFSLDYLTDEMPAGGIYMRGRLAHAPRIAPGRRHIDVRYGIEQLYVEQGTGRDLERRRGNRQGLQIPMEVDVAIGFGGRSVVRGFRWSRLGTEITMLRANRRQRNTSVEDSAGPLSPRLEIRLENVSDAAVVVADPGNHCGFHLEKAAWVNRPYRPVYVGCRDLALSGDDRVTLAPGESYTVELDLSEPRWHVEMGGKTGEIGGFAQPDAFRMVYRAPAVALSLADDALWRGALPSRAFTAFQLID